MSVVTLSTQLPAPTGWVRAELEQDSSWIRPLAAQEITDLETSLRHVLTLGKTEFELSAADFELTDVTRALLLDVMQATQTGYGLCLMRGFPVAKWSKAELRTLFWCLGLCVGVPRPQGKQSQYVSDVTNTGGTYRGGTGRGYNTKTRFSFRWQRHRWLDVFANRQKWWHQFVVEFIDRLSRN